MSRGIPITELWNLACADAERVAFTHRNLTDPKRDKSCDLDILKAVEREMEIREGICRALAWMQDHSSEIAEIKRREKVK